MARPKTGLVTVAARVPPEVLKLLIAMAKREERTLGGVAGDYLCRAMKVKSPKRKEAKYRFVSRPRKPKNPKQLTIDAVIAKKKAVKE